MLPVIGIMWSWNQGDILEEVVTEAIKSVDQLLVVDDGSSDNSVEILSSFNLPYLSKWGENNPNHYSKRLWRRQHLLDKAVEMYGREIWIQVIESDMILLDTNIKDYIKDETKVALNCIMCNMGQKNLWPEELDSLYPNWGRTIKDIMPDGYVDEVYPSTFRPLEKVMFDSNTISQWPIGLDNYGFKYLNPYLLKRPNNPYIDWTAPILAHYGYRGTRFYKWYMEKKGEDIIKKGVDLSSRESILSTVRAFNYTKSTGRKIISPLSRINLKEQFFNVR